LQHCAARLSNTALRLAEVVVKSQLIGWLILATTKLQENC